MAMQIPFLCISCWFERARRYVLIWATKIIIITTPLYMHSHNLLGLRQCVSAFIHALMAMMMMMMM